MTEKNYEACYQCKSAEIEAKGRARHLEQQLEQAREALQRIANTHAIVGVTITSWDETLQVIDAQAVARAALAKLDVEEGE